MSLLSIAVTVAVTFVIGFFFRWRLENARRELAAERFRQANLRYHVSLAIEDLEKDRENQTCAVVADFLRSAP